MKLYARADVVSVTTPVGHTHDRKVVKKATRGTGAEYAAEFAVDCPACEVFLLETGQWARDPSLVEKTPDEIAAAAREDRETEIAMKQAGMQLRDQARERVRARA